MSGFGTRRWFLRSTAGRVGRTIADALARLTLLCVTIELDDRRVEQARVALLGIIHGDATHEVVLEAAGLSHARALVVTVTTYSDVRGIIQATRQVRSDLPIIARADSPEAARYLYALGVDEVTSPLPVISPCQHAAIARACLCV
jgi:K+:H+ antiporter